VVLDDAGRSDFGAVRTAVALRGRGLVFVAFDLTFLDGNDLRALPIEERRAELRQRWQRENGAPLRAQSGSR
jgi:bifunctional non-homologous end joining protein LigD